MREEQHTPTSDPSETSTSATTSLDTPESTSDASATLEQITEEPSEALPLIVIDDSSLKDLPKRSTPSQPSAQQPWQTLTRRQILMGMGIAVGVVAIGTGTTLALLSGSSSSGSSSSPSTTRTASTPGLPPAQTPVSEEKLNAWRTKRLTAQPSQRFKHHMGTTLVPLGVVEPNYPNRFNPYHVHLQGYVLGGVLVAKTQFFLYLGLESLDGTQFVAKVRVGPVDQTNKTFGLLVLQQSTDDIEGGQAEFPQATLAPRTLYQALPSLVDHCIEVDFIRQPLPADAHGIPPSLLVEINQQAPISDQFLRVDFETIHHTPLAHISASELAPIRYLIDASPIVYASAAYGARYPLVTQLVLRHTDQLYSKLVSGR